MPGFQPPNDSPSKSSARKKLVFQQNRPVAVSGHWPLRGNEIAVPKYAKPIRPLGTVAHHNVRSGDEGTVGEANDAMKTVHWSEDNESNFDVRCSREGQSKKARIDIAQSLGSAEILVGKLRQGQKRS
jgi:hypothetical protein